MQHKASEIYIVKQRRGNYMNVFVSGKKKKKKHTELLQRVLSSWSVKE